MVEQITFELPDKNRVVAQIRRLICAGYTGRDQSDIEAHMKELATIGIGAPPHIPMLFPIMPALLSQSTRTYVLGENTAPEVEFVLFRQDGADYVTVGSDQTDSVMEALAAAIAKNMCAKSVAPTAWPLSEVRSHWDKLELELTCEGRTMQRGRVELLMAPDALHGFVAKHDGPDHEGRMVFSGTFETQGKYPKGEVSLAITLTDPVLRRQLRHVYTVTPMQEFFPREALYDRPQGCGR
jgi:hypothetical protein